METKIAGDGLFVIDGLAMALESSDGPDFDGRHFLEHCVALDLHVLSREQ